MGRTLIKRTQIKLPKELAQFFANPPLLAGESVDEYTSLIESVAASANPTNPMLWFCVKDIVELTFDMRRERKAKTFVIELMQQEVVFELLKTTCDKPDMESDVYRIFGAADDAQRWASDPETRAKINATLTARGYSPDAILAKAYVKGASQIDAIDRRIASYESRRIAIFREIERINEALARQLEKHSSDIIEGEFSEAAE
jgi:hypothetical protein